jgi:uncharacterized membrane protein
MPALPSNWDAFHPIVVHFPIALHAIVPLIILAGLLLVKFRKVLWSVALAVMIVATISAAIAMNTGEAAEDAAEEAGGVTREIHDAIHEHEEHAEAATKTFVAVTFLFAVVFGLQFVPKLREKTLVFTIAAAVLLIPYAYGLYHVAWAGHEGGRLVHVHGVRAQLEPAAAGGGVSPPAAATDDGRSRSGGSRDDRDDN